MPKAAGEGMKTVQGPSRPQPPSRPIKSFAQPADGPHRNPPAATPPTPSNAEAAKAVRIASSPGGIDVRKRYDDSGNLN
jgi:hypothetical protein